MPRKKQTVQKQKRQKTYAPGEMAGDAAHVKPRGVFKLFNNYALFAAIGTIAIVGGLLLTVLLSNNTTSVVGDDNGVRGEGVTRVTPEAGETSTSGASTLIKEYTAPPPLTIDPAKSYTATLKTEKGDIVVELDPEAAPETVNNFVFLAKDGFYDGSTFFRVVADESGTPRYVQAGDPTGTGSGGPGYEIPYEASDLAFTSGTLAMAKPDGAGSLNNGSQFYFTLQDEPTREGRDTAFGKVTTGLDLLSEFEPRDTSLQQDPPPGVRILSVEINES